jgi:hypothetical protein
MTEYEMMRDRVKVNNSIDRLKYMTAILTTEDGVTLGSHNRYERIYETIAEVGEESGYSMTDGQAVMLTQAIELVLTHEFTLTKKGDRDE